MTINRKNIASTLIALGVATCIVLTLLVLTILVSHLVVIVQYYFELLLLNKLDANWVHLQIQFDCNEKHYKDRVDTYNAETINFYSDKNYYYLGVYPVVPYACQVLTAIVDLLFVNTLKILCYLIIGMPIDFFMCKNQTVGAFYLSSFITMCLACVFVIAFSCARRRIYSCVKDNNQDCGDDSQNFSSDSHLNEGPVG